MKALTNACIYDFENYHDEFYILFDSDIKEVGYMKDFKGADEIYDCTGCLVMPGLTNCHTHIYSTLSRGMSVPFNPKNFRDILDQMWWKLDSQLDNDAVFYSGLVYGSDCIKNGVTSIIDHHASGLFISGSLNMLKQSICDNLGLRGIFCFETSDRFDLDECIEENLRFSKNRSENCAGLFGMHASMSLSDQSLKKISSCIGDMPIHIHVAESRDDIEDCFKNYNMGIVERLEKYNLLKNDSILAHCVHIKEDEAALINENGCFAAFNPTSNMNNAVGLADYGIFKSNNIKCVIGNDGLGANITRDHSNIVFTMKYRMGNPTKFNLCDLLGMINNGYEYIGKMLNIKIGRIKKGYKADMIVVPYNPPTPINEGNILGHLFFGIYDNFHPRDVWASGKCLMKDYKLKFDTGVALEKSREQAIKVWKRIADLK